MSAAGLRHALVTPVLALLLSCSGYTAPLYSFFYQVPNNGWLSTQEYFFPIAITPETDTTAAYTVTGIVRLEAGYTLESIPIGIVYESPSHSIESKTVSISLTDVISQKGGYNYVEVPFVIEDIMYFPSSGTYTYSYRHLLTDSIAKGVREVGIWIAPAKP